MIGRHTLEGLVVDPIAGARPARLVLEGGTITRVEDDPGAEVERLLFPGFVDLQVYDASGIAATGVTAYLQATQEPRPLDDPLCLGLHLEGPFLNPEEAGAIPVDAIRPVDLALLAGWLDEGSVRLVTVAPEVSGGLEAVELAAAHAVVGIGHTRANAATTRAALDAGARFATHLWNAMAPARARSTGPVPELLLDDRVVVGLIADGRHLHPRMEELTVRVAGAGRVALTSDRVAPPGAFTGGRLKGGDRAGAALVARMARFGLAEAAGMASLVPARLLGLADRGRLAPGFRSDVAVLSHAFEPLQTFVGGEIAWTVRYSQAEDVGRDPA